MPDSTTEFSPLSRRRRRLVLVCAGTLCLGFAFTSLVRCLILRYPAYSYVDVEPFTNAVSTRSFERQAIRSIPAVHRLQTQPLWATYEAWAAWSTNKSLSGAGAPFVVEIRITVLDSSPEKAEAVADKAAEQLCGIVQSQYGGKAYQVLLAEDRTDRWWSLRELKFRVARFFNAHV